MKCDRLAVAVVMLPVFLAPAPSWGMGWCLGRTPTLREDAGEAKVILLGTVWQSQDVAGVEVPTIRISHVIKPHPILGGREFLELPGLIEPAPGGPSHQLVFADVYRGRLDIFRAVPVAPAAGKYLWGLLAIDARDGVRRLRYCLDYLQHADPAISADAHREFGQATDREVAEAATFGSPRKLRAWLQDPKTPPYRFSLYGLLLGYCGGGGDGALLGRLARKMMPTSPQYTNGLLAGYVLLDPGAGWAYVRALLRDSSLDFTTRYSALRAIRYLYDIRPKLVSRRNLAGALAILLNQNDIADLAIDDLRKRHCWDQTDRILSLYYRTSHDVPIIRRSIIRYALQCPGAKADAFVAWVRRTDPQLVADAVEWLTERGLVIHKSKLATDIPLIE
jgi:hypothetical protein